METISTASLPAVIMAAITLYVSVHHLVIFVRLPKYRVHLSFAFLCLTLGIYDIFCAGLYSAASLDEGARWQYLQSTALLFMVLGLLWFTTEYTGQKSKYWLYSLYFLGGVALAASFLGPVDWFWAPEASVKKIPLPWGGVITYYERTPGPVMVAQSLLGFVVFTYCLWASVRSFRHSDRRRAISLFAAIGLFFLGYFNDSAVTSGFYRFIYLIEYAYMAVVLLMAYSLSSEVVKAATMEQALRASEGLLRDILNHAPLFIQLKNLEGRYILVNRKFAEQFKVDPDEPSRFTVYDVHRPEIAEQLMAHDRSIVQSGASVEFEETVEFESETGHFISVKFPLRDDNGCIYGVCGISTDITDRIRSETERDRLRIQLQHAQKMEAVGTLASGIAHDFNNILQIFSGNIQLLQTRMESESPLQRYLREIEHSVDRASDLVQSLLAFSRKSEPRLEPMNINEEIIQTLRILNRTIPKMIRIETNLADDLPLIQGDPAQLQRVMLNLASNACDAMKDGGLLAIRTARQSADMDSDQPGGTGNPGNYIIWTIKDTGIGMDESTRERIFEPFFTTKNVGEGTGLGMYAVYGIITAHGGRISCDSAPGEGTCFQILLPTADSVHPRIHVKSVSQPEVGSGNGERILLVDDEEAVLGTISEVLTYNGYSVRNRREW